MNSLAEVLKLASKLVSPSLKEEEKLRNVESKMTMLLERSISKSKSTKPKISLGGSYAKGTWLKGEADIDYFLLYPPEYSRENLESEAIRLALKAVKGFPINMRYAEHPYVESYFEKVRINLVPCYNVEKGKWQSAVDRSPFHTEYIKAHFDANFRRETRLLKKFVKAAGAYGAEVRTRGFSGYVCEVLTLNYGSLESVLGALSSIQKGQVVSVEPFDNVVASNFSSPLVILDPVDTKRNLGTAISVENLGHIMLRARSFLAKSSLSYFRGESRKPLKKMPNPGLLKRTLIVTFQGKPRSSDILWGELRKSASSVSSRLGALGFEVLRSEPATDNQGRSAFAFMLLDTDMGDYILRRGPEIYRREDLERYINKNKRKYLLAWIGPDSKAASVFRRDSTKASDAVKRLLSNSKYLEELGLSKAIKREIRNGFSITDGLAVVQKGRPTWLLDCVISLVSGEEEFER